MANPEHVKILAKGIEAWNAWRKKTPGVRPDLTEANLNGADLKEADLIETRLFGANLGGANLWGADLTEANLNGAILIETNLTEANLRRVYLTEAILVKASLRRANLHQAFLSQADLTESDLTGANLNVAYLGGANLSQAVLEGTVFAETDLTGCVGLETMRHRGKSGLDPGTVEISGGELPISFLRGCGWPDVMIDIAPTLWGPIQFYSAFISYSAKDDEFVHRLYADLQDNGVRCWFAPEDMKIGGKIREELHTHIRLRDKLVLVLSEDSINSRWVELEVETAFEEETRRGETVLFPIRLDDSVFGVKAHWAQQIQLTRNIGDFTAWKDHDSYQKGLERVFGDLRPGAE